MRAKYVITGALSAMMIFSLVGCGGSSGNGSSSNAIETSESTTATSAVLRSSKKTEKSDTSSNESNDLGIYSPAVDSHYIGEYLEFDIPSAWERAKGGVWQYIDPNTNKSGFFNESEIKLKENADDRVIDGLLQDWLTGNFVPNGLEFAEGEWHELNDAAGTTAVQSVYTNTVNGITYVVTAYTFVIDKIMCTMYFYDESGSASMVLCSAEMLQSIDAIK